MVDTAVQDYKKLSKAFACLRDNKGCHFILTNQDATYPTGGTVYPGVFLPFAKPDLIAFPGQALDPCPSRWYSRASENRRSLGNRTRQ